MVLPKKEILSILGESRQTALKRYCQNERSLLKKGTWPQFETCVLEYPQLGHAEKVPADDLSKPADSHYYLPMHGVLKESSTTTKLRIVFDASAKTTNGASLNDLLEAGPSLYPLLPTILNRFRLPLIGVSADISKMFREIGLQPSKRDLHRFLLPGTNGKLVDHRMTRLTFGVTCSPFLATRVLLQVAEDHEQEFPRASHLVRRAFYVDDCLTGADTLEETTILRRELNALLAKGCMTLRKWRSSSSAVMETVPKDLREKDSLPLAVTPSGHHKTLGVHWDTVKDMFHVSTPISFSSGPSTKRTIASDATKVYDVMGWYAPVLFRIKCLMQKLWMMKLGWDETVPQQLSDEWTKWRQELSALTDHSIPRRLFSQDQSRLSIQLHGFSDASLDGYGCVMYIRTVYVDTAIEVALVSAKTKVAPLTTITMPHLELCGALLQSKLLHSMARDLDIPPDKIYAWTDSSIVLGWLNTTHSCLKVFVSNRVNQIVSLIQASQWRYVATADNPADIASRGSTVANLVENKLWWSGPTWLSEDPENWPRRPDIYLSRELPDIRPAVLLASPPQPEFGVHISTYNRLLHVTAWLLRFIHQVQKKIVTKSSMLESEELIRVKDTLVRLSQDAFYSAEKKLLSQKMALPHTHALASLTPYLDSDSITRVGGRLQKAKLGLSSTHPIILSDRSHFTHLLVQHTHVQSLHAGPATVMSIIAGHYHVTRLRRLIRKISRHCTPCQKTYARTLSQRMGDLPADRVSPSPPFESVGIDYAGPMAYKRGPVRKPTMLKAYVAVFVCFSTKAAHLELVTDLKTETFLAALQRFIARRGLPSVIHSDNGTNFVGAHRELQELYSFLKKAGTQDAIVHWTSTRHIIWRVSPCLAPHFGGLWEAAMKTMKTLLRKVVGSHTLTFEELTTVLSQAESTMNSRPLAPLDGQDDDGISPLTPGHFLVGRPLQALPTRSQSTIKIECLRRWNLVQRLNAELWLRWRNEYLQHLQK